MNQFVICVDDSAQAFRIEVLFQDRSRDLAVSLQQCGIGGDTFHQRIRSTAGRKRPGSIPIIKHLDFPEGGFAESNVEVPWQISPTIIHRAVVEIVIMRSPTGQLIEGTGKQHDGRYS